MLHPLHALTAACCPQTRSRTSSWQLRLIWSAQAIAHIPCVNMSQSCILQHACKEFELLGLNCDQISVLILLGGLGRGGTSMD